MDSEAVMNIAVISKGLQGPLRFGVFAYLPGVVQVVPVLSSSFSCLRILHASFHSGKHSVGAPACPVFLSAFVSCA